MRLFDDSPREREADAPPTLLARDPRLEDPLPQLGGDARPVVAEPHPDAVGRRRDFGDHVDAAAAAGQHVDGVLDDVLERPLQQHRVAGHGRQVGGRPHLQADRAVHARKASAEILLQPAQDRRDVHPLQLRPLPDQLEALRDLVEALDIDLHLAGDLILRGHPNTLAR